MSKYDYQQPKGQPQKICVRIERNCKNINSNEKNFAHFKNLGDWTEYYPNNAIPVLNGIFS